MLRPRHRWECNIQMHVRETDYENMLWTEVTLVRLQWWGYYMFGEDF
jgi:hypothetical protein